MTIARGCGSGSLGQARKGFAEGRLGDAALGDELAVDQGAVRRLVVLDVVVALAEVDAGAVAKLHTDPEKIKQAVFEARLAAIELALSK